VLDKEWFSADELAGLALPGMPGTKRGVQMMADLDQWVRSDYKNKYWRMRAGRGGGVEFHYTLLSTAAQAKISIAFMAAEQADSARTAKAAIGRDEAAARFDKLPQKHKDQALFRLNAIQAVDDLHMTGVGLCEARAQVARILDVAPSSISGWEARVQHVAVCDRKYYLASHHAGRAESVECHPDAWEFLKADYLRLSQPTFEKCYRDLKGVAAEQGWTIPSARTLQRRIDALPEGLKVLTREGQEAIKRIFPAQERDRSVFHALQAVNADGHKWDVFVKWPDGTIGRVMMVAFQDLYSGKMLSYRLDRSENKDAVRLAFGDLVEKYGIPDECLLDNGRAFASKWMSGGIGNRYRFKVKDEDPDGIMKQLGVTVHWATPYHGQSKPIERGFRDFAGDIAKDLRFEGAYTGNSPVSKPENYGSKAVPFELFAQVVAQGVAEHNARVGRKTKVAAGRSFDQTFKESYEKSEPKKATAEQRRLWLLAAEGITAAKVDGSIKLLGNRYWSEFLHEHRGQKLVIRFDPQQLHQEMHVYRLDGSYLGAAKCIEAVGFFDTAAGRDHAQTRGRFVKATKAAREALIKMTPVQAAKLLPEIEEPEPAESKVVRPVFATRGNAALQPRHQEDDDPQDAAMAQGLRRMNQAMRGRVHLHAVPDDD
jgi:putative transposase